MGSIAPTLPTFRNPPVNEVVLSVQFDPLAALQIHHFGLWTAYRDWFPSVQSHPPIERAVETFQREQPSRPSISFELVNSFPTPRVMFLTQSGNDILQLQRDRFVVNWRRLKPEDSYPRYPAIRTRFETEFAIFERFVESEKLGRIVANQCEVTYINQIQSGVAWDKHAQVGKVLNIMAPEFKEEGLPIPEQFRFAAQYLMGPQSAPTGRLHLDFVPAFRAADRKATFMMSLTARGKPMGDGFQGVLQFFDEARANIVRGFRSLTTPEMHREWGIE